MRTALLTPGFLLATALSVGAPALAQTPPADEDGTALDASREETIADTASDSDPGQPFTASDELSEPALVELEPPAAPAVLLMAPASVRAEWTAALQIELASRGVLVVPMDAPEGPTVLIRSAEAQRALLARDGASAILVIEGADAFSVHVLTPESAAARTAPVSTEADPRTAALIAVSLWDEQPLPFAPPAPAVPTSPLPSAEQAAATSSDFLHEEPPSQPGEEAHVSGRFGTGGFGFFGSDTSLPGTLLRGGLGLRFGVFEMNALGDIGLMLDRVPFTGDELQPLFRVALSVGLMGTVDIVGLHGGVRGSIGYVEVRTGEAFPPDPFNPDGEVFVSDGAGFQMGIGGYLAVSFALSDAMRLFIRAEVEASEITASFNGPFFSPTLSAMLAVE